MSELEYLRLSDNQFSGEIPAELGNLSNLKVLLLRGNRLIGQIPSRLGNLADTLRTLLIADNERPNRLHPKCVTRRLRQ